LANSGQKQPKCGGRRGGSRMRTEEAVHGVSEFVKFMTSAGVENRKDYSAWKKEHEEAMSELFWYEKIGKMPKITSLINADFHKKHPLVLLNYSKVAHNTLHGFDNGWTDPVRICRGTVFDLDGNLVALGFPKFFNYGMHPETMELPGLPCEATVKKDGHLGIIFEYANEFIMTTRGSFTSNTSKVGNQLLAEHISAHNWSKVYPREITALTEFIHPMTEIYTKYDGRCSFDIIGAYNRNTLEDFSYQGLQKLGETISLPVTELWTGESINDLIALMQDRSIDNQEGYVLRFSNGLRIKVKFIRYLAKMAEKQLGSNGHRYLMNKMRNGKLQDMINTLEEEIYDDAIRMLGEIMLAISVPGKPQDKWRKLYNVVPPEKSTDYFRGICRKFVKAVTGQS